MSRRFKLASQAVLTYVGSPRISIFPSLVVIPNLVAIWTFSLGTAFRACTNPNNSKSPYDYTYLNWNLSVTYEIHFSLGNPWFFQQLVFRNNKEKQNAGKMVNTPETESLANINKTSMKNSSFLFPQNVNWVYLSYQTLHF